MDLLELFNFSPIDSINFISNYHIEINNISNVLEHPIIHSNLYCLEDLMSYQSAENITGNFVFYIDDTIEKTDVTKIIEKDFYRSNVLIIRGYKKYRDYLELINNTFFTKNSMLDFIYHLTVSIQNKDKIEDILNYVYSYFENPILVVDDTFTIINHIGYTPNQKTESVWEDSIEHGYMPSSYVKEIIHEQRFYKNLYESSTPIISFRNKNNTNSKYNQLSGRVMYKNNIIGYIKILEYNRSFTDRDKMLLSIFCRFISTTINSIDSQITTTRNTIEQLLKGILSETYTQGGTIDNRRRIYGIKFYENKYVITFKFLDENLSARYYNILKNILSSTFNRDSIFIYDSKLVFLFDSRLSDEEFESVIFPQIEQISKEQNCQAFVSLPFNDLLNFKEHYNQTIYTKNSVQTFNINDSLITYKEIFEKHILLDYSKKVNLKNMIHPTIKKLKEYDEQNNSSLIDTLSIYLSTNQNISEAAKKMHIHYNTMRYRIDKISEVINLDLSDPEMIKTLILSYRIIDLYNHIKLDA